MDFSVHRNRDGMSNWADDSPKSATDAMNRSLSGKQVEGASALWEKLMSHVAGMTIQESNIGMNMYVDA